MVPIVVKTPHMIAFYLIFTFLTTYGVLNLIVSAFCEQSLVNAEAHELEMTAEQDKQRERILKDLRKTFKEMDEDKSGEISEKEFTHALCNNIQVIDSITDLGLGEERNIFGTLDCEGGGSISYDIFFEGLMLMMKGLDTATAKNLVPTQLVKQAMMRHSKVIEKRINEMYDQQSVLATDIKAVMGIPSRESPTPGIPQQKVHIKSETSNHDEVSIADSSGTPFKSVLGTTCALLAQEKMLESVTVQSLAHAVEELVGDLPKDKVEFAEQLRSILRATGAMSEDLRCIQSRLSSIEEYLDAEEISSAQERPYPPAN